MKANLRPTQGKNTRLSYDAWCFVVLGGIEQSLKYWEIKGLRINSRYGFLDNLLTFF